MEYCLIKDTSNLGLFLEELAKDSSTISVDVEASKLDPFTATLLLIQVEINNKIFVFDVRKLGERLVNYIISLIKDSKKLCLFHNAKFDIKMIAAKTGELLTNVYDTMLAEILLYQGLGKNYPSYAELCNTYLGIEVNKEVRNQFIDFNGEITDEMYNYSAIDIAYLKFIREKQLVLIEESRQTKVLELENNLVPVVAQMELNGVLIDKDYWLALEKVSLEKAKEFEDKVLDTIFSQLDYKKYKNPLEVADALKIPVKKKGDRKALEELDMQYTIDWLKDNFNVGSNQQMKIALNLLGVPVPNTNEKTLVKFKNKYAIIELLLSFREHNKKISNYGSNFLNYINPVTGRIHANLEQLGTATGRFSSDNPNLQNIPREQEYRRGFIARPGYKILAVDYSQQEFRLAGAVSRDLVIIGAYLAGKDMHIAAGGILFKIPIEQVGKEQRGKGKTFNFAAIYGTTIWGLAKNMGIPIEEGEQMLKEYWAGFSTLHSFKTGAENKIVELGYSKTPLGRRRYFERKTLFEDYKEREKYIARTKREGFNHIIQGGAADITKLAMCKAFYENPFGEDLILLLQVHDEILYEVKDEIALQAEKFVVQCMEEVEQPFLGEIPAKADASLESYWVH